MRYDVAIVGSSFAGSLLAVLARRLGKSVVLLERGRHPRFVIGESSTPLANLLLEELADRHDLPWLRAFSKWGTWQSTHPAVACGLKRGFSFYFHRPGQAWTPTPGRDGELLVAASPNDALADTHWYRPDFDACLVGKAQEAGVEYVDEIRLQSPEGGPGGWRLTGDRAGVARSFEAAYLVDASGPRGFLSRSWGLPEKASTDGAAGPVEALYSHFGGVRRWEAARESAEETPPFPPDDAALHHVFPGGWIWVLRFNNGVTSAGCAVSAGLAQEVGLSEGSEGWRRLLERLPSVGSQFASATALRDFVHVPRLSYQAATVTGPGWCLLPGAAGFINPLLSTGFVLNLLGLERLASLWAAGGEPDESNYGLPLQADLEVTDALVRALYRVLDDPPAFRALVRLYFAAASFAETARRLGRPDLAPGFLLRRHPVFSAGFHRCLLLAGAVPASEIAAAVAEVIEPFDVAGINAPGKRHWHGCDMDELFGVAHKLGVGATEVSAMLARMGLR